MTRYQILKSVYGKDTFDESLDKLNKVEFKDLCENHKTEFLFQHLYLMEQKKEM